MKEIKIVPIGYAKCNEDGYSIVINKEYQQALKGLEEFGHINVIWWFSECDNSTQRSILSLQSPYKHSPQSLGVFASRSPERPNPIALTVSEILAVDLDRCEIQVSFLDALDGTPIIDIKPYTPSFDRVEQPVVPDWQSQWPMSTEASGLFDWNSVFNF